MSGKDSSQGPRVLDPYVMKALNKIKRPSTGGGDYGAIESGPGKSDTPVTAAEVAQQLEAMEETFAWRLFCLRSRPRR